MTKQYPLETGMQVGNFSQASSDFSMIGTALKLCHPDRQHDPEFLLVAPATPPFQTQNVTTHRKTRIRHVVNDVAMHVS